MTELPELGGVQHIVRIHGAECLPSPDAVWAVYGEQFPEDVLAGAIAGCGKSPWPSVQGNPPVYRDRPYYDARRLNDNG